MHRVKQAGEERAPKGAAFFARPVESVMRSMTPFSLSTPAPDLAGAV